MVSASHPTGSDRFVRAGTDRHHTSRRSRPPMSVVRRTVLQVVAGAHSGSVPSTAAAWLGGQLSP